MSDRRLADLRAFFRAKYPNAPAILTNQFAEEALNQERSPSGPPWDDNKDAGS